MWDLIVSVPDHCLSFYFTVIFSFQEQDLSSSLTEARYDVRCRLRNCHTLPFF